MKVRIPGTKIDAEVVSNEECERAALVICCRVADVPVAHFPDDLIVLCGAGCGSLIRHRPHAPKAPLKVCMQCAVGLIERGVQ